VVCSENLLNINYLTYRLGVQPQNGIPDFILHFPLEPSDGYLRFEGNGKISFGKVGKKEGKGKGKDKRITKFAVVGSGIQTHNH
jgi:hypothetical protein